MKVLIYPTSIEAAKKTAELIADHVKAKPNSVLGLATGNTQIPVYQEMVRLHREGSLDFSQATTFNLDEYVGIPDDHPERYRNYMRRELFEPAEFNITNTHLPPNDIDPEDARAVEQACQDYENKIENAGGIDLQLLGVGTNGHIGFDEPGTSFTSRTELVWLQEETIKSNSAMFDNDVNKVPKAAFSMGIGTILDAREIVLLATGDKKAKTVRQFLEEPPTTQVPASALAQHSKVTIILDSEAASQLEHLDRYQII